MKDTNALEDEIEERSKVLREIHETKGGAALLLHVLQSMYGHQPKEEEVK